MSLYIRYGTFASLSSQGADSQQLPAASRCVPLLPEGYKAYTMHMRYTISNVIAHIGRYAQYDWALSWPRPR